MCACAAHVAGREVHGSLRSWAIMSSTSMSAALRASPTAGHGTHTAATVGGLTYGVAKNVTLWAVRAMNCDGDAKVSSILEVGGWAGVVGRAGGSAAVSSALHWGEGMPAWAQLGGGRRSAVVPLPFPPRHCCGPPCHPCTSAGV